MRCGPGLSVRRWGRQMLAKSFRQYYAKAQGSLFDWRGRAGSQVACGIRDVKLARVIDTLVPAALLTTSVLALS